MFRMTVAALALLLMFDPGFAGPVRSSAIQTPPEVAASETLAKADAAVVVAARAGMRRRVIVQFDSGSILEEDAARHRLIDQSAEPCAAGERAALRAHEAANEQTRRQFDAIRSAVFPGGMLGASRMINPLRNVPMAIVDLPDFSSLVLILSNPKVIRVHQDKTLLSLS